MALGTIDHLRSNYRLIFVPWIVTHLEHQVTSHTCTGKYFKYLD